MAYKFSNKSNERLQHLNPTLRLILEIALKRSDIDFSVTETHRSVERQQELFKQGKSKIDGVNNKSKHNYYPSEAVDIAAYINGIKWDVKYYYYIAGIITSVAEELGVKIRWGGNFDMDNDIGEQSFNDLCHIEIIDEKYIERK